MSVLQLRRRNMVVVDDQPIEDAIEIERPFPLRELPRAPEATPDLFDEDDRHHEEQPRRSFAATLKGWFTLLVILAALGAYPVLIALASGVGDRRIESVVDRTQWTAPAVGAAAGLLERHYGSEGWASDAASWAPMARLTAKPALQHAMAESVGEYLGMMAKDAAAAGQADPDLSAAARLVSINATGIQLRAARDALVNYDRRLRRRGAVEDASPAKLGARLRLIESWAAHSQSEITRAAAGPSAVPLAANATRAVYVAKGRAQAAVVFLETLPWPDDAAALSARNAALQAWNVAAEFHPLIVLNGPADGSLLGNHAVSMGFLIAQAQSATAAYLAAIEKAAQPTAPVAIAASAKPAVVR